MATAGVSDDRDKIKRVRKLEGKGTMAKKKDEKMKMELSPFRMFLYLCMCGCVVWLMVAYTVFSREEEESHAKEFRDTHSDSSRALNERITEPILLWWTGFTGDPGSYKKCGEYKCFFTSDIHYYKHHMTQVMIFYGSDIKLKELPLPRHSQHEWALLHEESPKNNYALLQPEFIELFNHTATFKRESDFPLTLQSLESLQWLESKKYMVSTEKKNKLQDELSPLVYVQSDCTVPSDRDNYVSLLMKHINVDSYGQCVNNKGLPDHLRDPIEGMEHKDFYAHQAQYKFTLAMENAVCDDYVTEKIWRPLMLGSVPIIQGSPKIRDLLPDNHSAIIIDDFKSPKDLAKYLRYLNQNDEEYDKYLHWKTTGVTNKLLKDMLGSREWDITDTNTNHVNFIDAFECFICKRVQENHRSKRSGKPIIQHRANKDHLSCPPPFVYDSDFNKDPTSSSWAAEYKHSQYQAKAVKYFHDHSYEINAGELHAKASELNYKDNGWF